MKERIAKWYKIGLWTAEMVQDAVDKGVITELDCVEIQEKISNAGGDPT